MNLDWLANIQAVEVQQEVKVEKKKVSKTPTNGLTLRIHKDGSVYPSDELVQRFGLEYPSRGAEAPFRGQGLDVFSTYDWVQFPTTSENPNLLVVAAVSKDLPKVTLFGSVDYNEDGTPKKSVMNQGSKRPELVQLIRDTYNLNIETNYSEDDLSGENGVDVDPMFGDKGYIDLEVNTEYTILQGEPKYFVPKKYVKGKLAGTWGFEERQGLNVHPLVVKVEETVEVSQEQVNEVN